MKPRRLSDHDFRRLVEEAKARHNLSDIVARHTKLARRGKVEMVGLCPFHAEKTPSFEVNDAKGTFHCWGCGASGDAVRFLVERDGLSFRDALTMLDSNLFPVVTEEDRTRRLEEATAEDAARVAEARDLWARAVPAAGTPAEIYVRSRGITMRLPPSIRFARTWAWRDRETGECGPDLPALIGSVTDAAGDVIGVQRIFLSAGGAAKANMKKPKLSLGRPKGGALWVYSSLDAEDQLTEAIITEGPEDGLSLAQELYGSLVGVALGTAMMPFIDFPREITSIVIAGQNDKAGRAAVESAALALAERGYAVRTMWPDERYKDWNDQLRGIKL